jgi:hypothetical protein
MLVWNVQWYSVVPFGTVKVAVTTRPGSTVPVDEDIAEKWTG